jgi:GGDEF domain-containing protein
MGKKIVTGYLVFCVIFFIALLSIIALRLITDWNRNLKNLEDSFQILKKESLSWYLSQEYVDSGAFFEKIHDTFEKDPRLLVISIYTKGRGIEYIRAKSRAFIQRFSEAWQGELTYQNLPPGSTVITLPFSDMPGKDLFIDGVYVVIGKSDIFPIVKDTFIMLFIFLIATCIVMLLIPGKKLPDIKKEKIKDTKGAVDNLLAEKESKDLFSPSTGLGWKNHLPQRLKFELDRAASFDQNLLLALIAINNHESRRNKESIYSKVARILLEDFTFQDLIFEYEKDSYALIIPDIDIDRGIENLENFKKRVSSLREFQPPIVISIGLSARNGRLVDGSTLLSEASKALGKALDEKENTIIAFKADPDKYRDMISQKS